MSVSDGLYMIGWIVYYVVFLLAVWVFIHGKMLSPQESKAKSIFLLNSSKPFESIISDASISMLGGFHLTTQTGSKNDAEEQLKEKYIYL